MSVTNEKTGFTIHIDGLVMRQVDQRAGFTNRSRSGEISYLLGRAIDKTPSDEALALGAADEEILPVRTSIYIGRATLSYLGARAAELHLSTGKLINLMLKFILDEMARETLEVSSYMERRGLEGRGPSQTSVASSPTD